jgi:hypothetical protein
MHEVEDAMPVARAAAVMRRRAALATGIIAAITLTVVGCGPRSDRLSVTGAVTFEGAPLDTGSIVFTSVGGEQLVSSGAMIEDGAYIVPQAKGLLPGTYRVEISSPDAAAPLEMSTGGPDSRGIPIARDRIPEEYNINSDKTVEVTVDGDNSFDFNIASKPTS